MISVCMVLFVLGLFGMLLINTQKLTVYLQENVLVIMYFDNQTPEDVLLTHTSDVQSLPYVKSAAFVTGEQAAMDYKEVLGKDFVEVLGNNPLPASIEVNLNATSLDGQIDSAIAHFNSIEGVTGVEFQQDLVDQIRKNKRLTGIVLIGVAMILLLVALVLINNTIRLDVYAQRFVVKSMQLVGASEWFIIKPFVIKAMKLTLWSTFLALGLVILCNTSVTNWVESNFFEVQHIFKSDITIYSILFACIAILGFCIVVPSTYFATKKYLKLRVNDLY
ncbi:MAG: cell division transport system permease protein [bacterium]|jgi:cell division transport system permease protein